MDLLQLINDGAAINITVSSQELKAFVAPVMKEAVDKAQKETDDVVSEALLNSKQVRDKLGVCHTTLWKREKTGILIPVRHSRKKSHRLSDVQGGLTNGVISIKEKPYKLNSTKR